MTLQARKTEKDEPMRLLEEICRIAREAGAAILPHYANPDLVALSKADASPVTAADHAAEAVIVAGLRRLTPDIPIVAEEMVAAGRVPDVSGGRFWLVDPLDGTKEFVKKIPEFTVNIALVEGSRPVLGVVYAPASDSLYAGAGPGTAFMEIDGHGREPMAVRRMNPEAITVALSRTYGSGTQLSHFLEHYRVKEQIQSGSSIKFCLVARGLADVYPRYGGSSEWDTAAGQAVLEAAGGSVCEADSDRPLAYGKPRFGNPSFIAWGGRESGRA